jgi:hypothetical protein
LLVDVNVPAGEKAIRVSEDLLFPWFSSEIDRPVAWTTDRSRNIETLPERESAAAKVATVRAGKRRGAKRERGTHGDRIASV